MSLDTCPKKADETVACSGFANANAKSKLTSVGEESVDCLKERLSPAAGGVDADGGIDWNRQVVVSVLKRGVEDDATAWII
jgi:hypothetical protein